MTPFKEHLQISHLLFSEFKQINKLLFNPNLGGLFKGSFSGGGRMGYVNLVRKYTHIYGFRKYNFWYQDPLNFADVSIFLQKITSLWQK